MMKNSKDTKDTDFLKKDLVLTVRVDSEMNAIIQSLAKKDDRTVAWMLRKLIAEALEARGLWPLKENGV